MTTEIQNPSKSAPTLAVSGKSYPGEKVVSGKGYAEEKEAWKEKIVLSQTQKEWLVS